MRSGQAAVFKTILHQGFGRHARRLQIPILRCEWSVSAISRSISLDRSYRWSVSYYSNFPSRAGTIASYGLSRTALFFAFTDQRPVFKDNKEQYIEVQNKAMLLLAW